MKDLLRLHKQYKKAYFPVSQIIIKTSGGHVLSSMTEDVELPETAHTKFQ